MTPAPSADAEDRWMAASVVTGLFATDPAGLGGVSLRALSGPARDAWLAQLRALLPADCAIRRVPLNTADERLLGGLDLVATLAAGRPVVERGILAQADGGVVLLAMAERVSPGTVARLAASLDTAEIVLERDGAAVRFASRVGVVALDEGMEADERPPAALLDRLAFHLDLGGLRPGDLGPPLYTAADITAARTRLPEIRASEAVIAGLCSTALALGVWSVRAPLLALHAARCSAALDGRNEVSDDDATLAARLLLAPRATRLPAAPPPEDETADDETNESEEPENQPPEDRDAGDAIDDDPVGREQALSDLVLAAARAAIPAGLLAQMQLSGPASRVASSGRAGALQAAPRRGRPIGTRPGKPQTGRLNVVATLHAAAPWQAIRRQARGDGDGRLQIRADDFRVVRFQQRSQTTAIFVVDASGSSALNRLAETKGAVELLLADCYVRRDQVALLAFRGATAALLLPPTSSLVRARRSLAGLPGGGGTPLASALDAAMALADAVRRKGPTPLVILLTDGRANIARDGTPGRSRAADEALAAAQMLRAAGVAALLIDTSPKPQPTARDIAQAMGATYLPLPYADSAVISRAVRTSAAFARPR